MMLEEKYRKIKHRKAVPEVKPIDIGVPPGFAQRLFMLDDGRVLELFVMITGRDSSEIEVSEIVFKE